MLRLKWGFRRDQHPHAGAGAPAAVLQPRLHGADPADAADAAPRLGTGAHRDHRHLDPCRGHHRALRHRRPARPPDPTCSTFDASFGAVRFGAQATMAGAPGHHGQPDSGAVPAGDPVLLRGLHRPLPLDLDRLGRQARRHGHGRRAHQLSPGRRQRLWAGVGDGAPACRRGDGPHPSGPHPRPRLRRHRAVQAGRAAARDAAAQDPGDHDGWSGW